MKQFILYLITLFTVISLGYSLFPNHLFEYKYQLDIVNNMTSVTSSNSFVRIKPIQSSQRRQVITYSGRQKNSDRKLQVRNSKIEATDQNLFSQSNSTSPTIDQSYTLSTAAKTSAGVYDGDILIRTLWSNKQQNAGTYSLANVWDGKDDNDNYVANKNYTIKVVSNNVTYKWLKPIGNTSLASSGSGVHHAAQLMSSMVEVGGDMYYGVGYNEIGDTHCKFATSQPNVNTTTLKGGGQVIRYVASDGNIVYSAGQRDGSTTFITGIVPNQSGVEKLASFSAGTPYRMASGSNFTYSAFDITGKYDYVTGLAVQKTGNLLLASHAGSDQLKIFNKTTGAFIRTNTVLGVSEVKLQNDNAVWLLHYTLHLGSTTVNQLSGAVTNSPSFKPEYNAAKAFDNDVNTYFSSSGGVAQSIGLSFDKLKIIKSVRISAPTMHDITGTIEGDDNGLSVILASVTVAAGQTVDFPINNPYPRPFRTVRLYGAGYSDFYVAEMKVFGYDYSGQHVASKCMLNSDGTISSPLISITGLNNPLALAVSPDKTKLAIADRGTYHQVKIYNTSNGSLSSTIGRAENYSNPTVYDDKFFFNNTRIFRETDYGTSHAHLTYQSDGSLWVNDYGNMRCQHFAANGKYLNNIQYMGYSYNCQVDINNPTRVFSDFLEFSVNYSDNSWKFVRNWSKNITLPTLFDSDRMRSVATLSNGRTYALYNPQVTNLEVIELDPATGIRHTNAYMDNATCDLNPDGSVWQIGENLVGQTTFWKRKPLTGFDASNNPKWDAYVTLETSPVITDNDPVTAGGYLKRAHQLSDGAIATFCSDNARGSRGHGYHLGKIKNSQWIFRVSPSTRPDYLGDFPDDGAYDIGNQVNNAGSFMQVVEKHIFWGYTGEFWKASQTNMYNHYLDNGLFVGQFGTPLGFLTRNYDPESATGDAGNALTGTYVKVGNDIHFFHCDEGQHASVHHWKISNLNSIKEFNVMVTKSGIPVVPTPDYINLMADIPISGTINSGTGRWTYSPTSYVNQNYYDRWEVRAGGSTYKRDERSLRFTSYPVLDGQSREAYCDLSVTQGVVNNYSTWQITGKLMYPEVSEPYDNFIDIVDNAGKVIVRISRPQTASDASVKANQTPIVTNYLDTLRKTYLRSQKFSIRRSNNNLLVSYGGYPEVSVVTFDPTATISSPTTLHVHFYSAFASNGGHQIDLANLKFYTRPTPVAGAENDPSLSSGRLSGVTNGSASGEGDKLLGNLKVYPVPANDFLWIQYYAEEAGNLSAKLINMTAQPVLLLNQQVTQGNNTLKISVKGLPQGLYILNLNQGDRRVSKRVILAEN